MGWKYFERRWTRGMGGIENWTIFMDVKCIIPKLYTTSFTNPVLPFTVSFSVNYIPVILFPLESSWNNVILFLCVLTGYQKFSRNFRL